MVGAKTRISSPRNPMATRAAANRFVLCAALVLSVGLLATGCFDPIVGAECAEGYALCEGQCRVWTGNPDHCVDCGHACLLGCSSGLCLEDGDAGARPDSRRDADSAPPADALVCEMGIPCPPICVDEQNDPYNCGFCGN